MRTLTATACCLLGAAALVAATAPPNIQRALTAQRSLVAANPGDAQAHNDLGNLLLLAGDEGAAAAAYDAALEIDPALTSAWYNLGLLLHQEGEPRRALAAFEKAVELDGDHAWAWFQLGRVHEATGRSAEAVEAYARAFTLDPQLSFSDVNPQIIDSRLVTEALLNTRSGAASAIEAPRSYEEPGRIASLLLPQVPEPGSPAAQSTPPAAPEATDAPVVEEPLPPAGAEPGVAPDPAPANEPPRVLSTDDLQPGSSVGEAEPPAETPGSTGRPTTRWQDQVRQRGNRPGTPPTERRPGYVPGSRSTGQLDQGLQPVQ